MIAARAPRVTASPLRVTAFASLPESTTLARMAAAGKSSSKQLKVTLARSVHGQLRHIAASVRGLGLRHRQHSVTVADTAENRGMIRTAGHLLEVEPTTVEHK